MRPMSQPPLRSLEPGPVLGAGGVLRADDRGRHRQRRSLDRLSRRGGRSPSVADHDPPPHQAAGSTGLPGREPADPVRPGRPANGPGPVDDRAGEPLFRPGRRQSDLGLFLRAGARRSGGRFPFDQPADAPRAARRAGPLLPAAALRSQGPDAHDRPVTHLPALRPDQRDEPRGRGQLCARAAAGPRRRGPARCHLAGHGSRGGIRLARLRRRGVGASRDAGRRPGPRNRPVPVPRRLWAYQPAGAAGAEQPAQHRPGVAHARRAHLHREDRPQRRTGGPPDRGRSLRSPGHRRTLSRRAVPAANPAGTPRAGGAHPPAAHASGSPRVARLGLDQLARVRLQPLTEAVMNQASRTAGGTAALTRRGFLRVGSLYPLGIGLGPFLQASRARAGDATPPRGKAQACILLWLEGGPGQMDTWDPKGNSGFKPIDTSVPGIQISELFPRIAQQMDKLSVIRSVRTEENNHPQGTYNTLTGHRPNAAMKFPSIGSILCKETGPRNELPQYALVPQPTETDFFSYADAYNGAFLGANFNPMIVPDPSRADFRIPDLRLPKTVTAETIEHRRSFLKVVDRLYR